MQQQQLSEQLLGFHPPAFILILECSVQKKCDGLPQILTEAKKRMDAQTGRWEHIRQISCDDTSSLTSTSALDNNKDDRCRLNRQDNSGLLSMFLTCKVLSCQVDYWFYLWLVTSSTLTFYYSLIMVCYLHCHPPTKVAFICSHHLM